MIFIDCPWCETELALDRLDATSVDCPDCRVEIDFAADPELVAIAA